jgi:hypothetical protein
MRRDVRCLPQGARGDGRRRLSSLRLGGAHAAHLRPNGEEGKELRTVVRKRDAFMPKRRSLRRFLRAELNQPARIARSGRVSNETALGQRGLSGVTEGKNAVMPQCGIRLLPTIFIIDAIGIVAARFEGY